MTEDKHDLMPDFCTMRDALDEIHLECRFPNGEKYAAVSVCIDKPELARFIMHTINTRATLKSQHFIFCYQKKGTKNDQ
jgi:hypothetical protein